MKISNDHLAPTCSVIDTADLARVQGAGARFSPGDGRVGRSSSPAQGPAPAPAPLPTLPQLNCPANTVPNYIVGQGRINVSTPAASGTIDGTFAQAWCGALPR